MIRTNPPGASVYVNEQYIGASPAEFEAKSWSVKPHVYRYRVAKAGYLEREGEIPAHLSVGRIIGAYFSACMSCGHGFFVFDDETVVRLQADD
ncbi:MAG: PEGA domain-containing protein [Thermoanaerobaculia bacterium]